MNSPTRVRLLAETNLSDQPGWAEANANDEPEGLWTDELLFEVEHEGKRWLVRSWFEASGHGESEIDDTQGVHDQITIFGTETSIGSLVTGVMLAGEYDPDRRWVDITEAWVAEAKLNYWLNH